MKEYLRLPKHFAALADKLECTSIANTSKVVYSSEWTARTLLNIMVQMKKRFTL